MVRDQLGRSSVVQTERAYAFLEVESRRAKVAPRTETGTAGTGEGALPDKALVEVDPATGEPIVAQKPAQGQRTDLKRKVRSKR